MVKRRTTIITVQYTTTFDGRTHRHISTATPGLPGVQRWNGARESERARERGKEVKKGEREPGGQGGARC